MYSEVEQPYVVQLDGASVVYHEPVDAVALHPTTLTVSAGEFVSITGPSGSGKSTLLSVIALLRSLTQGKYLLCGIDTEVPETERASLRSAWLGMVFQSFHLLNGRTVAENVNLSFLYNRTVPRSARAELVDSALERVGMMSHKSHVAEHLSGGQRQRVAIARAIVAKPQILLADEPTGNLDSENSRLILTLLEELNDSGQTVLCVTHDETVAQRARRQIRIEDGHVVGDT